LSLVPDLAWRLICRGHVGFALPQVEEEERRMREGAEGGPAAAALPAPAPPAPAPLASPSNGRGGGAGPSGGGGGNAAGSGGLLAPQVELVDGRLVVVQQSLTAQAQPEAAAGSVVTVDDNPVRRRRCFWLIKAKEELIFDSSFTIDIILISKS
jgi:hypothetical protein